MYIGTSAAELLHFVAIPGDSPEGLEESSFILASRFELSPLSSTSSQISPGVQQITILSKVNKACILCNGALTFYSLPELTPAFGNLKVVSCSWVGGVNLDAEDEEATEEVVMICMKTRIRLVRIGEEARSVKNIEYPSCLSSVRRGGFACVADPHAYSLLDVANQQKVPLFPISSTSEEAGSVAGRPIEDVSSRPETPVARSVSSQNWNDTHAGTKGHKRNMSLGTLVGNIGLWQPESRSRSPERQGNALPDPKSRMLSPSQAISPVRPRSNEGSPDRRPVTPEKPLPPTPNRVVPPKALPSTPASQPVLLEPHICSPIPTEFLLTTGTFPDDPGVGIFVNLDGDVVRGTLEFGRYPSSLVVDGGNTAQGLTADLEADDVDGYVLASITRSTARGEEIGVEIQRWDIDSGGKKEWLSIMPMGTDEGDKNETENGNLCVNVGLGAIKTTIGKTFFEVGEKLRARRLKLQTSSRRPQTAVHNPYGPEQARLADHDGAASNDNSDTDRKASDPQVAGRLEEWEIARNQQEDEFGRRLGEKKSHIVVWTRNSVWWVFRNPLVLKLDATIDQALELAWKSTLDLRGLVKIVNSIRGQEARTETEFLSLEYIRQKISLIVFTQAASPTRLPKDDYRIAEELLIQGGVDPRLPLSIIPLLRQEIVEGAKGIWIHAGVLGAVEVYASQIPGQNQIDERLGDLEAPAFLTLIKRFLLAWRERKGFGSIVDGPEVFQTVDAALLHLFLYVGRRALYTDHRTSASLRAELYSVVDHGVDCFDRAVDLLEEYHRLYVLSRLYQSRKMSRKVLSTWRRIIEGERDDGGELADGENEVRKYLVRLKDSELVEEYGTWLARRNPVLGVHVFTDDNSRVKFQPSQVVDLLRKEAPEAVKVYLEHLVFGKKTTQYANDLISYYLDNVLSVLEASPEAQSILSQSYETYRALRPPKPTYRQFITENSIPASWWHDRLRLLELIGGSHGGGFSYDVSSVLHRVEPFEQALVPESIILDGRQGRHQQALRLLTHGLGDYHTAINYCLLGGSSIFHPTSGPVDPSLLPSRSEQATLFSCLFAEFLLIVDPSDCVERTSQLLDRFGAWFDVADVLARIPDSWSVELLEGYLVSAFRRLVMEKSEAMVVKALSGAENLKISADFVEKCEGTGPRVEGVSVL